MTTTTFQLHTPDFDYARAREGMLLCSIASAGSSLGLVRRRTGGALP